MTTNVARLRQPSPVSGTAAFLSRRSILGGLTCFASGLALGNAAGWPTEHANGNDPQPPPVSPAPAARAALPSSSALRPQQRDNVLRIYRRIILPVHEHLARTYDIPVSINANGLVVAIGFHESAFGTRDQRDAANAVGPATGYYQFERLGGVVEVLQARKTKEIAAALCARAGVAATPDQVWRRFATPAGDELATAFARLLLWKDPARLPAADFSGVMDAYRMYDRNWRPGAKRPHDWTTSWAVSLEIVNIQHR